ncbi:MAG: DMT family transporter [Bacteroidetes bacterium]|nr:DMT family transporter [Bacteroidota bacterium]
MDTTYWGELAALLTALSWSIGIFPFTEASRRMNPNTVNHFRLLLGVILLSIFLLLAFRLTPIQLFTLPLPQHWLWFGLSGLVGLALGDYFGFTSYAILGTRTGSLLTTLAPGASLVLGYFLLGEALNWIGIFGMLITISGIIWISMSKKEQAKIADSEFGKKEKGILFGVLAALCQGFGLVFAKMGMGYEIEHHSLSSVHATFIRLFAATFVTYGITITIGRMREINEPLWENKNKGLKYIVAGTIFGPTLGVVLSMYAVSLINVSVAQTIFSMVPVIVLPLGYVFYREKITLKSTLGALVAISGVVILIWRNVIETAISR